MCTRLGTDRCSADEQRRLNAVLIVIMRLGQIFIQQFIAVRVCVCVCGNEASVYKSPSMANDFVNSSVQLPAVSLSRSLYTTSFR